ncbi:LysR family transcriptional regulator [Brotaphodocola sp.]|uniref:LysR family transcriptional regulator n=1 Tax=Brotaphodocola sp. TaxID=3073577 RepID=UPI003D7DC809
MNLKTMSYLVAIAETGTLSGAGRKLGISQPTLSAFLSGLELELGIDLFVRNKKQLIPTPAGRIYLDAAKKILAIQEQTLQSIHQLSVTPTETIQIGVTPLRGSAMAAQIFSKFSQKFPMVRLEMREGYMRDLREMVRNGSVSCSLGTCFDTESTDFDYVTLFREEIVLGVPAFHPLASRAENREPGQRFAQVSIEELADSPFILMSPGSSVRSVSDYIFKQAGFHPTVVFESGNNIVIRNMVGGGAGAGFLPLSFAIEHTSDIVYFSLSPRIALDLCVILRKNYVLSESERYFIYLMICHDLQNPIYTTDFNAIARSIWEEFSPATPIETFARDSGEKRTRLI